MDTAGFEEVAGMAGALVGPEEPPGRRKYRKRSRACPEDPNPKKWPRRHYSHEEKWALIEAYERNKSTADAVELGVSMNIPKRER